MKKLLILFILFKLNSCFAQTTITKNGNSSTLIREYGDLRIEIEQIKGNPSEGPYCKALIKTFLSGKFIDLLGFDEIEPVGGEYGIYFYDKLVNDHFILTKYGDYDGRTIIINNKGVITNTIGGSVYVDEATDLLFSNYMSDLSGYSIYDLNADTLYFESDFKYGVNDFYRLSDINRFFIQPGVIDSGVEIWEIEADMKREMAVDMSSTGLEKILNIIDPRLITIECECHK